MFFNKIQYIQIKNRNRGTNFKNSQMMVHITKHFENGREIRYLC